MYCNSCIVPVAVNYYWLFVVFLTVLLFNQGKCMKQVQDVIERLWDFIDKLDINTFGEF